jgi:hypothetical protein
MTDGELRVRIDRLERTLHLWGVGLAVLVVGGCLFVKYA